MSGARKFLLISGVAALCAWILVPIYLIFRNLHLLDNRLGIGFVLLMMNLPILIWMLSSSLTSVTREFKGTIGISVPIRALPEGLMVLPLSSAEISSWGETAQDRSRSGSARTSRSRKRSGPANRGARITRWPVYTFAM